ncbi:Hpt domain-containing protein [Isoptericola haloaureus]|uniref:Hpt domain-containing protein n=1 Tax=Isoptericola haloaureus TaxID=1542902 RepID=A0ABU7Z3P1_9MICO
MTGTPACPDDDPLQDTVAELARSAGRRNQARSDRVADLLRLDGGVRDPDRRREAARLCHTIAGSAGTFGDEMLADAARALQHVLESDGGDDAVLAALERFRATASARRPGGAGS